MKATPLARNRPPWWAALSLASSLCLCLGLEGCATPEAGSHRAEAPPTALEAAALRQFAAQGYAALEHHAVDTRTQEWIVAGQPVALAWTAPLDAPPADGWPVVIYLPGLGESSMAGMAWRQAWAEAGYAVFSVQALPEDAHAWQSELARMGEFKALGRQRYGGAALAERVRRLDAVLSQARAAAAATNPAGRTWPAPDWRRTVLAGFDLGAYTAMALVGEQVRGADLGPAPLGGVTVRAAIALSPYADLTAGGIDTRYAQVRTPVLCITSDADGDALGLVTSPALRQAPYEGMPPSGKALLTVQGLSHARLAGSAAAGTAGRDDGPAAPREPGAQATRPEGPDRDRGGSAGTANPGGRRRGAAGELAAARTRSPASAEPAAGLSASVQQMRLIVAQDVSTAFLDAHVKNDELARNWLASGASRWLAAGAALRQK